MGKKFEGIINDGVIFIGLIEYFDPSTLFYWIFDFDVQLLEVLVLKGMIDIEFIKLLFWWLWVYWVNLVCFLIIYVLFGGSKDGEHNCIGGVIGLFIVCGVTVFNYEKVFSGVDLGEGNFIWLECFKIEIER